MVTVSVRPSAKRQDTSARRMLPDTPEVMALIAQYLELVETIANQVERQITTRIPHEDLVSFGNEGLLLAARRYDASHGVPFGAWATVRIRGAMIDGMRKTGGLPRRAYRKLRQLELANSAQESMVDAKAPASAEEADDRLTRYVQGLATAMAMGYVVTGTREDAEAEHNAVPTPEDQVAQAEVHRDLIGAVEMLPEPERYIVRRFYFDGVTVEHAAAEIGRSKSWGSRLHTRGLELIAKTMKRAGVDPTRH
jgi:RNA polymerase sigma factor for flagellar operon FliA